MISICDSQLTCRRVDLPVHPSERRNPFRFVDTHDVSVTDRWTWTSTLLAGDVCE